MNRCIFARMEPIRTLSPVEQVSVAAIARQLATIVDEAVPRHMSSEEIGLAELPLVYAMEHLLTGAPLATVGAEWDSVEFEEGPEVAAMVELCEDRDWVPVPDADVVEAFAPVVVAVARQMHEVAARITA